MLKNIKTFSLFLSVLCLVGCGSRTHEFFFGSKLGPDPFVIGSTLAPLKSVSHADMQRLTDAGLPKPKAILLPSQMPSRAKKASKILDLKIASTQGVASRQQHAQSILRDHYSYETTSAIAQNSLQLDGSHQRKVIDFHKFDQQMQQKYSGQQPNQTFLSSVLGAESHIDPTIREGLKQSKK